MSDDTLKPTDRFGPTSRYYHQETRALVTEAGDSVVYLLRRLVPPVERFVPIREHQVTQGERLDTLTASYLGDPEQFWRICDANGVLWPAELEEVARRIRITLPEGIPAPPEPER